MSNFHDELIHVTVPGSPADPRDAGGPPGIVVHYTPELHPDDVTVVDGIRVTTPARTLVDLAEHMTKDELRGLRGPRKSDCSTWQRWRRHTRAWNGGRRWPCCMR